jgi:hypothetical protein
LVVEGAAEGIGARQGSCQRVLQQQQWLRSQHQVKEGMTHDSNHTQQQQQQQCPGLLPEGPANDAEGEAGVNNRHLMFRNNQPAAATMHSSSSMFRQQ